METRTIMLRGEARAFLGVSDWMFRKLEREGRVQAMRCKGWGWVRRRYGRWHLEAVRAELLTAGGTTCEDDG